LKKLFQMRNSKLLNKKYLLVILFSLFLGFNTQSQEPVDIWNLKEEKKIAETSTIEKNNENNTRANSIYEMQTKKVKESKIEETQALIPEKKIIGLYDPEENGLDINMWTNSNGDQIVKIFKRINKLELSKDASEILDILLLTNAHYPEINISKDKFLDLKSKWLIKNSNFQLIENYLLKNQIINDHPILARLLVDDYLSRSDVKKACEIFTKIEGVIQDEYLSKFDIYCLIYNNNKDEAQLLIDLKKESGFRDKFFESKINYLMGYEDKPEKNISEKTILSFHLSHRTNPEFKFEPKDSTSKQIWKYLSSANLLGSINDIDITNLDKIASIEKAAHEGNYSEKNLFDLYKRFQFNINQLLNIKESTKILSTVEARALIYQGILITKEINDKLLLLNVLKNSFNNDNIENAFDLELRLLLSELKKEDIPANFTRFYENYIKKDETELTSIKINNKILHQSKLINFLKEEASQEKITKELNDFLKKIKRNKKYFFSKKDVILIEAFKSDGVEISQKFKKLYAATELEMPSDIQTSIDNRDIAVAMLRIVEVIGQDELKDIDEDTLYFIISTLNQLDIDPLRNKILLKVLPLKV
jgi:hypothetical protein